MPLQFQMPAGLGIEKFIEYFHGRIEARLTSREKIRATFYDSFDWRLYAKGFAGELTQTNQSSVFQLKLLASGLIAASTGFKDAPVFSKQFKPGKLRNMLEPILEVRALLPVCTLDYQRYLFALVNQDGKTLLRMMIEEYEQFNTRVCLQPIKGYEKTVEKLNEMFIEKLGLSPADQPILSAALALQGRKALDYSAKPGIDLEPDMPAESAIKIIFSHLLKTLKSNEQGTLADTDSEFLHDFRVSIRRTRTGLSQLKTVIPEKISMHFVGFFSWLGQITSPTRDLDVYLLNFDRYKNSLPVSIREDINPLHEFLSAKKQKAHQELANQLRSPTYHSGLAEWEAYLDEPIPAQAESSYAGLTVKELADLRIWKNYQRILRKGNDITELSSAEAFHELRKSCKKLRYLMEFFQSLYPEQPIKNLIKRLKALQEVLGDFQDYEIQQCQLKQFGNEMLANNIAVNTFLAMGVLIQNLETRKHQARKHFESRFEAYRQAERELALQALFDRR